eukprot:scaffold43527_cov35-Prasinocladus_malaysianus.AAC.1
MVVGLKKIHIYQEAIRRAERDLNMTYEELEVRHRNAEGLVRKQKRLHSLLLSLYTPLFDGLNQRKVRRRPA